MLAWAEFNKVDRGWRVSAQNDVGKLRDWGYFRVGSDPPATLEPGARIVLSYQANGLFRNVGNPDWQSLTRNPEIGKGRFGNYCS